jgi:beta-glucosidase
VYAPEIGMSELDAAGLVPVDVPERAEIAVIRLAAPYEPRDTYMLESSFHAGSLEFDDETTSAVLAMQAHVPVILVVHLDRPAILTDLAAAVSALVGVFGVSNGALLTALTAAVPPDGRLPFELPRGSAEVLASQSDVPGGTTNPLFSCGHGLRLSSTGNDLVTEGLRGLAE